MLPPKEVQMQIQTEAQQYASAVEGIRAFRVNDQATYAQAGELVKLAAANYKALNERRQEITRPILQAKNSVDALFKPGLEALAEIERLLRAKLSEYTVATTKAQAAVMQQSAAQAQMGIIPTTPIPEPPKANGVAVRVSWDFEVYDSDKVPRDLCSPDPKKIAERIAYADTPHTPPQDIPGVRFFLRGDTRVRTK